MLSRSPRRWAGRLAFGLVPLLLAACAYGPGWHHGWGGAMPNEAQEYRAAGPELSPGLGGALERFNELNLSAEQEERIAAIREQHARDQVQRYREWEQARRQLAVEVRRAEPDPDAVADAYEAAAGLERDTLEARVRAYNQMRAVLSAAQRERLDAMRQTGW